MPQYVAIDDRVEVNSRTINSVLAGMKGFRSQAERILQAHGIFDLSPEAWIPQANWLEAFRTIGDTIGQSTLFAIGKMIPETAEFPPDINSIEGALASIDVAYHMNHRLEEKPLFVPETGELLEGIGHYRVQETTGRSAIMVCRNPYPCRFDEGIIQAISERFKPDDSLYVQVDHDAESACRNKGGESCTYHIKW